MAQYINKDILVEEIKRRIKINKECILGLKNLDYYQGKVDALNDTLSFINTLEVQEVDSDNNPKSLWFDAQGEYLPEYDREVIVLIQDYPDIEEYLRVAYGHRPNPNRYIIKDSEKLHPITYGKGGWNGKNIKWWLDVNLPILQTLEKI